MNMNIGQEIKAASPLENIHRTAEMLRELEERVTNLTINLVGEWRGPEIPSKEPPAPTALFDVLGNTGVLMQGTISRINTALSAIDRKLP